jgi:DICT domain-containing protein
MTIEATGEMDSVGVTADIVYSFSRLPASTHRIIALHHRRLMNDNIGACTRDADSLIIAFQYEEDWHGFVV